MTPWRMTFYGITASLFTTACIPQVQVAVPDKPITINLNIKIEHEIKVKVDKELDELFSEDDEEVF